MRRLAAGLALGWISTTSASSAGELGAPGLVDLGARAGVSLPFGSFDAGTRASDTSFGALPLALDGVVRIGPPARWTVALGGLVGFAPTVPRICASTVSECVGSVGRDLDLAVLARLRGPRTAFFLPEMEIGTGWTWSLRTLADGDARATRRFDGPLLLRAALAPTFLLGARTRLGLLLGGSLASTASSQIEAPGIDHAGLPGRVHARIELGVRFGLDLLDRPTDRACGAPR